MKSFLQSPLRYLFAIVAVLALQDVIMHFEPMRAALDMILVAICAVVGLLDTIRLQLEQRSAKAPETGPTEKESSPSTESSEKKRTTDEGKSPQPRAKDSSSAKSSDAPSKKASRAAEEFLGDSDSERKTKPTGEPAQASRAASRFLKDD